MASKINGLGGNRPAAVGSGRVAAGSSRPQSGTSPEAAGSSGSVHITDAASQLATLEQAARELPVVDAGRVAAIRSALDQGSYTVVPQSVADNLLSMEASLRGLA